MILGITGKTGVGKHTAAEFFEQRGWKVLNADRISHGLYRPYKRVWREVVEAFGEVILNKKDIIDRQKLRALVFAGTEASKKALETLNSIVHPELKRVLKDESYYLSKKKKNTVIVAALWEQIGLFELCDKVLLIRAGEALSFDRLKKRDGIDFDMFERVSGTHSDPPHADFEVVNEGNVRDFYGELKQALDLDA